MKNKMKLTNIAMVLTALVAGIFWYQDRISMWMTLGLAALILLLGVSFIIYSTRK